MEESLPAINYYNKVKNESSDLPTKYVEVIQPIVPGDYTQMAKTTKNLIWCLLTRHAPKCWIKDKSGYTPESIEYM